MTRRLPDRGRLNPDCTSIRHGDYAAYRHGCRCPHAREHQRVYQKRLREGRAIPAYINGVGTRRRLRALTTLGWRWRDLGDRLGVSWQAVQNIALHEHRLIHVATVARVKAVYRELCDRTGPSQITARRAAAKGWLGPAAWVDIDDPACVPDTDGPDTPVVDEWAVAEALAGRLETSRLAEPDVVEAARRLVADGATPGQVRYRLRLSRARTTEVLRAVG